MNEASKNRLNPDLLALIALFLAAFIFRLIRLFDLDLNFDEVILLFQANHTFTGIWEVCKLDNNPPLYPWLVKFWMSFNQSDSWYRLFGAIMGSLTPPAAYLLGRELGDRKLGWLLGLATSISVGLIFYSQFVRMFNIQPFFACLSLLMFIKALKTNAWKYWFLTALTNLLGFYVYLFMPFLFAGQFIVLLLHNCLEIKKYWRPFAAHLPYVAGIIIWMVPLLQRFSDVQEAFWTSSHHWTDYIRIWFFFGTGSDFRDHFLLSILLNLPLIAGFLLSLSKLASQRYLRYMMIIFTIAILIMTIISKAGQSFFHERYLLYVQPIYIGLTLAGFYSLGNKLVKTLGIGIIFLILTGSLGYFYSDFYYAHSGDGFVRPAPYSKPGEGHNLSKANSAISENLKPDEVIIHYSNPFLRKCSYYASLYYHQFKFSEHIYSKEEIAAYNGRQYLQPGQQIRNLHDLDPLPSGIWLLTLNNADLFFNEDVLTGRIRPKWIFAENLPVELSTAGYLPTQTLIFGKVTVIHFLKHGDVESDYVEPADNP
ncbi:glycosyltransferase family 39 protein [bacterium]|nr:glycosyltransferase family 39 protein [bacterium]